MAKKMQYCFQRYEEKYLLSPSQYAALLEGLMPLIRPDEYGQYTICNLYYDTDSYQLIRASLEKPVYKEKLRLRSYGVPGDGDMVFAELKKKFDGVVYKRRAVLNAAQAADFLSGKRLEEGQICREIDWFLRTYRPSPKVFIAYDRAAFAGLENEELRFTFDTNLRWRNTELDLRAGDWGERLLSGDEILMEVKIPGTAPVWLARLLSRAGAYPISFSKYGTCYLQNLLPGNTTKEDVTCA